MKRPLNLIFTTFLLFTLIMSSCSNKDALFGKYEEIKIQIEKSDYEGLVQNFDEKSRRYIELITDTTQLEYDNLKRESYKFNLQYFSINYLFEFSEASNSPEKKYNAFFLYCILESVPLFDLFSEQLLLEDESKVGSENYVTVARKVNDKAYITKKIKFLKEEGEYKLNFLHLLTRNEKNIAAAVKKYQRKYRDDLPQEVKMNKIDSSRLNDFLYTYMLYSGKNEYLPKGYYYNKADQKSRKVN